MEFSSNKAKGDAFEQKAKESLEQYLGVTLEKQVCINGHKFDLISSDKSIIVECKSLEWTKTGNPPSAKKDNLDRAVNWLVGVSATTKILCMKRATHVSKKETLAEYYVRLSKALKGSGVLVYEIDDDGNVRKISE